MSAMVCGKRPFFEETPPHVSKRLRCSSVSPIRLSPPSSDSQVFISESSSPTNNQNRTCSGSVVSALDRLQDIFPQMDKKLLERALEGSGDLESAIKNLNGLGFVSTERNISSATAKIDLPSSEISGGGVASPEEPVASNLPKNGTEWVEWFVNEMSSSSSIDDAKARASKVLAVLEKSIRNHAGAEATDNLHKEHTMMKEQLDVLIRENSILKRAVAIQHERQKETDNKTQELHHLKQLLTQYEERIKVLEVNNYALTMHLRQAQQSSSIPGHYHPDVY